MMNKWLVAFLFLAVIFIDGIIFPALFNFKESFLTTIFLIATLLYYEVNFTSLVLGIAFAWLAEFYWGLNMGTLILPLFASVGVFFLLNKFLNTKRNALRVILGIIMFIVFWETSILVTKIL